MDILSGKFQLKQYMNSRTQRHGLRMDCSYKHVLYRLSNMYIIVILCQSLAFAKPTIFSMFRSSLNLSRTVPLTSSSFSSCAPLICIPQHSMTSGLNLFVFERGGLVNVLQVNECPWSKFADKKSPKWCGCPPNPIPLGMFSELKFIAHCQNKLMM